MRYFNIIFIILSCLLTWESGKTQIPSFYHLSTAEGLNDNNVICVATDKNGLVWLGTSEGLHSLMATRSPILTDTSIGNWHPTIFDGLTLMRAIAFGSEHKHHSSTCLIKKEKFID
ncbi:MAG: hypothetical protein IPP37_14855 [Saprospiraceae bacterium]|nr:hypothetical protein [Saprospiraceae bacterium]